MKERVKNVLNFKEHSRIIIIAAFILAVGLAVGLAVNKTGDTQSQLQENKSADETVLGTMDDQDGILIEYDKTIYVEGRKAVHMTIAAYEAWVAGGENAADVYDYAVPYIDDGAGTANNTYKSQLITYLSALFTEAYEPHYDGLHYEMTDYEETATASDYTATFLWIMYHKGNGLDVPSDLGKEQEANFSLKAIAKLNDTGLLDLDTIEVLADSSATGPANYVVPMEDFFPEK